VPAVASLLPSFLRPPAAVPRPDAQARPQPDAPVRPQPAGIDTWLIDRLFGRR
jgi:hypothetical protein